MKKFLALILSVLTLSSMLLLPVAASDSNTSANANCPFDINEFCNSAKLVSATDDIVIFEKTSNISSTTVNGELVDSQTTSSVGIVPTSEQEKATLSQLVAKHSTPTRAAISDDDWDKSGQVKIYATVTYSKTKKTNGDVFVKVTKVSGGISAPGSGASVGSGVSVTSNKCLVAMFGKDESSTKRDYKKTFTYDTGKRSWSSSTPSSWKPVLKCPANMAGCTYTVTLKRNTSWSVELPINICGNS